MTEAIPSSPSLSTEALPIPAYAVDAGSGNSAFGAVSTDLFYRDRDARLVRVFQALCSYAQQHKTARIPFAPVLAWMLNKGNAGITVELSLHHALQETLLILEKGGYARLQRQPGAEDPDTIELHDPMESRITDWLNEQYGVIEGNASAAARIGRAGTFPTLSLATTKFNLPPEQVQRLFLTVQDDAFSEPFFAVHRGRLIQIVFHEGYTKPFDIVLPPGVNLWSIFRMAVSLLKEFHDTRARFSEEIRLRLKAIPDMNLVTLDQIFQGLLAPGEILPEQKYIHWALAVKTVAMNPEFRVQMERSLNPEAEGTTVEAGRHTHVGQAAAFVHHALMNARESLKLRQWEKEAEAADRKMVHHHLIEECRHQVALPDASGVSRLDSVFYPVSLGALGALKDASGQLLLKDKYSDKALVELMRAEATEGVPPVIRLIVDEQLIFLHRFRLMDIMYAETAAETNRIMRKLAADWAELPLARIPEARKFQVSADQLTPQYRELLTYSYYVLDAYPTSQELVRVLFPQASDIGSLKLSQSDLAWTNENAKGRPSPQERCQHFRELLYTSTWSVTRRPLAEVLGVDYDAVIEEMKGLRKVRKSGALRFDSLIDLGIYRFVTGFLNSIWSFFHLIGGIFTGQDVPEPDAEGDPAERRRSKPAPRAAEPASKKPLSISQVADRFGVPPSRVELKDRIKASLKEWNQVLLDPKSMYPDWARLRVDEKDRIKKKLEGETRTRMAQAQERVDSAIEKTFEHMELEGLPPAKLTDLATDIAKQFRTHNLAPLVSYIRDSIVYLNTSE
jgi:hypothetical protein